MSTDPQDAAADLMAADLIAADLVAERQWPVVVTLRRAVAFGSETITVLTFRRGKLGDLKGMPLDGNVTVDQLLMIASRMCGQPTKVLEMLDDDDSPEVFELALGFFARSLGGGAKKS